MVEFIEQKMQESQTVDVTAVMDETERLLVKSKALIPLRPVNGCTQLSQWPMVNLRAREAERAAQMFAR